MKQILLSTLLPLAVALIPADQVIAQPAAAGIGVYSGPPFNAPVFGIFPLYYRGFYGNGMSMYGPPVPTFGPVAGTFNGSDYTTNQRAPFLPLNPGYYLSQPPRYLPLPPSLPRGTGAPTLATDLVMEVHLPVASADVFVDGNPTKSLGEVRMYSTPSFAEGENLAHQIRAEWFENGVRVSRTRITGGKAGEKIIVNFVEK